MVVKKTRRSLGCSVVMVLPLAFLYFRKSANSLPCGLRGKGQPLERKAGQPGNSGRKHVCMPNPVEATPSTVECPTPWSGRCTAWVSNAHFCPGRGKCFRAKESVGGRLSQVRALARNAQRRASVTFTSDHAGRRCRGGRPASDHRWA